MTVLYDQLVHGLAVDLIGGRTMSCLMLCCVSVAGWTSGCDTHYLVLSDCMCNTFQWSETVFMMS